MRHFEYVGRLQLRRALPDPQLEKLVELPDLLGRGRRNPFGPDMRVVEHSLGLAAEADAVEAAVEKVLAEGPRTRDLGGTAGTRDVRDAVIAALEPSARAASGQRACA